MSLYSARIVLARPMTILQQAPHPEHGKLPTRYLSVHPLSRRQHAGVPVTAHTGFAQIRLTVPDETFQWHRGNVYGLVRQLHAHAPILPLEIVALEIGDGGPRDTKGVGHDSTMESLGDEMGSAMALNARAAERLRLENELRAA